MVSPGVHLARTSAFDLEAHRNRQHSVPGRAKPRHSQLYQALQSAPLKTACADQWLSPLRSQKHNTWAVILGLSAHSETQADYADHQIFVYQLLKILGRAHRQRHNQSLPQQYPSDNE